jgi:hypothetical protein
MRLRAVLVLVVRVTAGALLCVEVWRIFILLVAKFQYVIQMTKKQKTYLILSTPQCTAQRDVKQRQPRPK